MRVSVLIPAYNCSKYIGPAIESALAQTFRDFEIIVVDDGSEDETASVVKQYDSVRYVYQEHAGVSTARNRALKEAKAELVTFLDADDLMLPDKIEKQLIYLEEHPDCEIVFCRCRNFTELKAEEMTLFQQKMIENNPIHLAGALIKADLFVKWGGFDIRLNAFENREWLWGVRKGGVHLEHCVGEVLYLRRIHEGNMSLNYAGNYSRISGEERLRLLSNIIRRSRRGGVSDDKTQA